MSEPDTDQYYDNDPNSAVRLLGSGPPDDMTSLPEILDPKRDYCVLEVTLNYPRTQSFKNMRNERAKLLYKMLFRDIIHTYGPNGFDPERTRYTYEVCQSGYLHLHGIIYFKIPQRYSVTGLICDCVKTYLADLPRKYGKFSEHFLFPQFNRYRSPSITIQWDHLIDDFKRVQQWETYIDKEKTIVIL